MRKLMLVVAMVAVVLVAAAPAIAQVTQELSERRITSGPASPKTVISNTGNIANLCPTIQQIAQTGNVANEQGVTQYDTTTDDITFNDVDPTQIVITPSETSECTQTIEQAAAAGPKAEAKAGKAEAKGGAPEAKAGKAEAKAGAPEAKAGELPKTGGIAGTASLLGLGAGALLVAGGLLARRIIR